jgi:uncharacterized protein YciI
MKYFLVEATYSAPIDQVREAYPRHRAWLQTGYDLDLFLCSGPKIPPTGGYLVARADSAEALKTMFEDEPLNKEGLASFTFTEFDPVKRQGWTECWFSEGLVGTTAQMPHQQVSP